MKVLAVICAAIMIFIVLCLGVIMVWGLVEIIKMLFKESLALGIVAILVIVVIAGICSVVAYADNSDRGY